MDIHYWLANDEHLNQAPRVKAFWQQKSGTQSKGKPVFGIFFNCFEIRQTFRKYLRLYCLVYQSHT